MSKTSTAFGAAVEKLLGTGHHVRVEARPGQGQNKSNTEITDGTGAVVAKFTAHNFEDLTAKMIEATRGGAEVSPTVDAEAVLEYLRATGAQARYAALDGNGDLVINPEFDTPVFQRQKAAAIRIGRQEGGVAVFDVSTGTVEAIPPITRKGH